MKKIIRFLLVIFIIILILTVSFVIFCFYKDKKYSETVVPNKLSASETVRYFVKYWDDGNNNGMKQLLSSDAKVDYKYGDRDFIVISYLFCDITCSNLDVLEQKAKNYDNYYDNVIVTADFSYKSDFEFGDKSLYGENRNVEFHLVKTSEDANWEIISWNIDE